MTARKVALLLYCRRRVLDATGAIDVARLPPAQRALLSDWHREGFVVCRAANAPTSACVGHERISHWLTFSCAAWHRASLAHQRHVRRAHLWVLFGVVACAFGAMLLEVSW